MEIRLSFDPHKNERNITERNLPFTRVAQFDWSTALISQDTRRDYTETRYQAMGYIEEHLHVLVFTFRQHMVHVISLRRANPRERKRYASQTES